MKLCLHGFTGGEGVPHIVRGREREGEIRSGEKGKEVRESAATLGGSPDSLREPGAVQSPTPPPVENLG